MPNNTSSKAEIDRNIAEYRKKIDNLDKQIIKTLAKRHEICEKIGQYKQKNKIKISQKNRENEAMDYRINEGHKKKLDKKIIKEIFQLIFKQSRAIQKKEKS